MFAGALSCVEFVVTVFNPEYKYCRVPLSINFDQSRYPLSPVWKHVTSFTASNNV